MKNKDLHITILIVSILLTAILGSIFVYIGMPWYLSLNIPSMWVPNILIPIVWTIIYILFAVIVSILLDKNMVNYKTTILLIINAVLNVIWCLIFFTLQNTLIGLIIIITNLIFGFLLIKNIISLKKLYGYILSIYPLWLCIATCLNLAIWILN